MRQTLLEEDSPNNNEMPNFWVYILYCNNGALYTGYTKDLIRRYQAHLAGAAAKYTRSFPPLSLLQAWPIFGSKAEAMQIERFIKKLSNKEKKEIINKPETLEKMLFNSLE